MGLSLGQALTKLQNEMPSGLDPDQTIAWLRDLVEQTDVSAPEGKAVVLFSGQVGNWHSGEIVESMVDAKPDTLWRIGQTQAGQLLEFRGRIPGTVYLINRLPLEHRSCRVSHGLSFPAIRIM